MAETNGWSLLRRFGPLLLIAVLVAAAFASGLTRHLSLAELRDRREALRELVTLHPILGVAVYVALYTALVAVSLPAALAMTLAGGFLFGPWVGGVAAAVGATLGACVIFLACRIAVGEGLHRRAGSAVDRIKAGLKQDAFLYLLTLRLLPVMPFWLVNLAAGLVDIPLRTFFLATLIGILPASLIYAGLGSGLDRMFRAGVRPHLDVVLEPQVLLPLTALSLLALAPILVRRLKRKRAASLPAGPG